MSEKFLDIRSLSGRFLYLTKVIILPLGFLFNDFKNSLLIAARAMPRGNNDRLLTNSP